MCNTLITTSPLLGFLSCPLSLSSSRRLPWRRSRSDCSTCHSLAQMSWLSGHERSMSDEYNMLFEIKTVYMSNDINGDMTDDLVFIINILKFTSFCLFASVVFAPVKSSMNTACPPQNLVQLVVCLSFQRCPTVSVACGDIGRNVS